MATGACGSSFEAPDSASALPGERAPQDDAYVVRALASIRATANLSQGGNENRHCEPPGRREAPPDDRLREAIQSLLLALDCFVASLLAMTAGEPKPLASNYPTG
jgi:hypothetical protein